jgi:phosphoribosylformylglycinamidine (FGAM) synthase-like amidotransferase family enzyme
VGTAQLAPGEYKVKVDGSNAIFTETQHGKSVTVPVKVENGDKKFDATTVDSSKQGDMDQIKTIDLGGSKQKLQFGQ